MTIIPIVTNITPNIGIELIDILPADFPSRMIDAISQFTGAIMVIYMALIYKGNIITIFIFAYGFIIPPSL